MSTSEEQKVITPVSVTIESESQKIELGPAARDAIRIDQVQDLREWLDLVVEVASEPLDELNRAQLEDLGRYLDGAETALNALWWLIPPDVETEDA